MKKIGQLKLFEGDVQEKVFEEANEFMRDKMTPVAQTHINFADGRLIYSVVVFYDV